MNSGGAVAGVTTVRFGSGVLVSPSPEPVVVTDEDEVTAVLANEAEYGSDAFAETSGSVETTVEVIELTPLGFPWAAAHCKT